MWSKKSESEGIRHVYCKAKIESENILQEEERTIKLHKFLFYPFPFEIKKKRFFFTWFAYVVRNDIIIRICLPFWFLSRIEYFSVFVLKEEYGKI